jgi:hypothetical protein
MPASATQNFPGFGRQIPINGSYKSTRPGSSVIFLVLLGAAADLRLADAN